MREIVHFVSICWQFHDPLLLLQKVQKLFEQRRASKCWDGTENQKLFLGTRKGNINTTPVTKQVTDIAFGIGPNERDENTVFVTTLVLVNGMDFNTRVLLQIVRNEFELGPIRRNDADFVFFNTTAK